MSHDLDADCPVCGEEAPTWITVAPLLARWQMALVARLIASYDVPGVLVQTAVALTVDERRFLVDLLRAWHAGRRLRERGERACKALTAAYKADPRHEPAVDAVVEAIKRQAPPRVARSPGALSAAKVIETSMRRERGQSSGGKPQERARGH